MLTPSQISVSSPGFCAIALLWKMTWWLTCAKTASTWEFMFPLLNPEMAFSQKLTAQNMKAQLSFLEMEQTRDVTYTPGLPHRIRLKLEFLLQSHCCLTSTFSIQLSLPYSLRAFSWELTSLSAPHMNIHLRVCFCGTWPKTVLLWTLHFAQIEHTMCGVDFRGRRVSSLWKCWF